jgi:hypothetical protein
VTFSQQPTDHSVVLSTRIFSTSKSVEVPSILVKIKVIPYFNQMENVTIAKTNKLFYVFANQQDVAKRYNEFPIALRTIGWEKFDALKVERFKDFENETDCDSYYRLLYRSAERFYRKEILFLFLSDRNRNRNYNLRYQPIEALIDDLEENADFFPKHSIVETMLSGEKIFIVTVEDASQVDPTAQTLFIRKNKIDYLHWVLSPYLKAFLEEIHSPKVLRYLWDVCHGIPRGDFPKKLNEGIDLNSDLLVDLLQEGPRTSVRLYEQHDSDDDDDS